jgi:hypothetical protein
MFRQLVFLLTGLVLVGLLVGLTIRYLRAAAVGEPVPVPDGDQEVAWINAATSDAAWERFVVGVHRAARDDPTLEVDDTGAYPQQAAAVPEVVVGRRQVAGKLRLRWYPLTSELNSEGWVRKLTARRPPPLVVIGGGTTDRARDLAQALAALKDRESSPLFLITTATAVQVGPGPDAPQLTGPDPSIARDPGVPAGPAAIYPGRTFRFCFNNEQMVRALLDFVNRRDSGLRPEYSPLAAVVPAGPWAALAGALAWDGLRPPALVVEWEDDPYSLDFSNRFRNLLKSSEPVDRRPDEPPSELTGSLPYSVGSFGRPSRREVDLAARLLVGFSPLPGQRSALVLPAVANPARRMLRAFTAADPQAGRHLVAVMGDAVSFNTVYRDAEVLWDSRLVSVPVVLFAHDNPIDWDDPAAGDLAAPLLPPGGTDDVLLNAKLVRKLADAAYAEGGRLVDRPTELANRLHTGATPPAFAPSGDRRSGDEYVVTLRPPNAPPDAPARSGGRAVLEVWRRGSSGGWSPVRPKAVPGPDVDSRPVLATEGRSP